MKFLSSLLLVPGILWAQSTSLPGTQPSTTWSAAVTQPATQSAEIRLRPPPKKQKSTDRALALSIATSAVSYVGLGVGAQVFASGFTRGVTFGMLGLVGSVIGPSTGKIYLRKGGGRLVLTTALRFAASTLVISGLVLAGDQLDECTLSDCGLIYGGTAALVGLGILDIATTPR